MQKAMQKQSGFTLIEVLVALTIFSVAAVTASSAASNYIRSTQRLQSKTLAHFVAKNTLEDIHMDGYWPTTEKTAELVSEQGRTWQVVRLSKATANDNIKRLTIVVSAVNEDGSIGNQEANLETLVRKPDNI